MVTTMRLGHIFLLLLLLLVALAGCTTLPSTAVRRPHHAAWDIPETVLITYHVQPGKEAAFQTLLLRAWVIYQRHHLVVGKPHIVVRDREPEGGMRFVEVFTWVSHSAPDQAPPEVQAIWNEEMSACEGRNGHRPIEGGEVMLLAR